MKLKEVSHTQEIDIRLTEKDMKALRQRPASMTTNEYLRFLQSVEKIRQVRKTALGPRGEMFRLL